MMTKPFEVEIDHRPWGKFTQFSHNQETTVKIIEVKPKQQLSVQRLAVLKTHFGFCRMHVDVGHVRRQFQKKKADGMPARHQKSPIGFTERMLQAAILNVATVQKQILIFARTAA